MEANRLDHVSKLFGRRRSRTSMAQEATPAVAEGDGLLKDVLFVQTYQSGAIVPTEGIEGRYTVTLEQGHGQTVYFSDRPDRIVGASPTPRFLEGLGFSEENPPNAALVVETAPGETDVAVVELFNPLYDPVTQGVTYEVEVLADWQNEVDLGFQEAPTDLAALAPSFGAAHLFIDDCADADMECVIRRGNGEEEEIETIFNRYHDGFCYSWSAWGCLPCDPKIKDRGESLTYWTGWCNRNPECANRCTVRGF
jgi:hypothetical protein